MFLEQLHWVEQVCVKAAKIASDTMLKLTLVQRAVLSSKTGSHLHQAEKRHILI